MTPTARPLSNPCVAPPGNAQRPHAALSDFLGVAAGHYPRRHCVLRPPWQELAAGCPAGRAQNLFNPATAGRNDSRIDSGTSGGTKSHENGWNAQIGLGCVLRLLGGK